MTNVVIEPGRQAQQIEPTNVSQDSQPSQISQTSGTNQDAVIEAGREEAHQVDNNQGPTGSSTSSQPPSQSLSSVPSEANTTTWAKAQATLGTSDVQGLVERFTAGASAHPVGLADAAQPKDADQADFQKLNSVLRRFYAQEALSIDAPTQEGRPQCTTPQAKRLQDTLESLRTTANGLGIRAQSSAAMHAAIAIQLSAEQFSSEKAVDCVANGIFANLLAYLAADNPQAAEAAKTELDASIETLRHFADLNKPLEKELYTVIKAEVETLEAAKTAALNVLGQAKFLEDGRVDIRTGCFEANASNTLKQFGGVMTPKRMALMGALDQLNQKIKEAKDAISGDNLKQACIAYADVRSMNLKAGDALRLRLEEKALTDSASALNRLCEPKNENEAPGDLRGLSKPNEYPTKLSTALALGRRAAERTDWQTFFADRGERFGALEEAVSHALERTQNATGEVDPSKLEVFAPYSALHDAALVETLLNAPWTKKETKEQVNSLLQTLDTLQASSAGDESSLVRTAGCLREALVLLRTDLAAAAERIAGAAAIAENQLKSFGVNDQTPLGGINGGLKGFASTACFESYGTVTK